MGHSREKLNYAGQGEALLKLFKDTFFKLCCERAVTSERQGLRERALSKENT